MHNFYYYLQCIIKIMIVLTLVGCIIWGLLPEAEACLL